jgi:hypothetical protein
LLGTKAEVTLRSLEEGPTKMTLSEQISSIDHESFIQAMSGEEPLVVVIKAALYIEHQLIGLIEDCVTHVDHLNQMQLDYHGRLQLAAALGLRPSLVPPLKNLGTIRNRFAHRLDAQLTSNEVNVLHQAFDGDDRSIIEQIYQRTRRMMERRRPARFSSLPALERFTLCATTLRGALIVARAQARTSAAERIRS